ncbi:MAG: hypothetical protein WAT79_03945 [Saprospiraceae bacterium]
MSVALPLNKKRYDAERMRLAEHLSALAGLQHDPTARFEPFDDGGMGSFRNVRRYLESEDQEIKVGEFIFEDIDNIGVVITVFSKDNIYISSVDFWKHDFSPIKTFPSNQDLRKPDIINRDK